MPMPMTRWRLSILMRLTWSSTTPELQGRVSPAVTASWSRRSVQCPSTHRPVRGAKLPNGDSPFLAVPASEWLAANRSAVVIVDRFRVSPGHALVVPRRAIATWREATDDGRADILALVDEVKRQLDAELQPDGYNVGFNAGAAAGQTVGHLHIHVIPRYRGDVPDPRGGVRHVLPGKGYYLRPAAEPYALVDGQDRL